MNMTNTHTSAWDNADFQAAVKATGKKQIIVAGITTDVCTVRNFHVRTVCETYTNFVHQR